VARAALDPDNASILVAGGGGIALEVTRRLKDMGAWVWQLQRSESRRCAHEQPSADPSAMQCCRWRGWVVQRAGGLWQGFVKLPGVKP